MILPFLYFIVSFIIIFFGIFVYLKNRKSKVNRSFAFLSFSIFTWLFASFIAYNCKTKFQILLWFKISYSGVIFIAITFYHFIYNVLDRRKDRIIVKLNYIIGLFPLALLYSNKLIVDLYKY